MSECQDLILANSTALTPANPPQNPPNHVELVSCIHPTTNHPETSALQPMGEAPIIDFGSLVGDLPGSVNVEHLQMNLVQN